MNDSRKRKLIEMTLENYFTLHEDPVNDFQREYATQQLISEELSLDDMRISSNDAMKKFLGVIRDIQNEKYNRDEGGPNYPVNETLAEDGLVKVFESKMSELYPLIMRSDTITFTFYFPWNLHFDEETEFKELGVEVSQISESDWPYVTDKFRANPKVSGVGNLESQLLREYSPFGKGRSKREDQISHSLNFLMLSSWSVRNLTTRTIVMIWIMLHNDMRLNTDRLI